jgi:hypothetical protein
MLARRLTQASIRSHVIRCLGDRACSCYKSEMPKTAERWLLYKYSDGEFIPLSKPFKTKAAAEKVRLKYPERERRRIGVGVIRIKE